MDTFKGVKRITVDYDMLKDVLAGKHSNLADDAIIEELKRAIGEGVEVVAESADGAGYAVIIEAGNLKIAPIAPL